MHTQQDGHPDHATALQSLWETVPSTPLARRCARWMGRHHAEAEDALSEARLHAWRALVSTTATRVDNVDEWFSRIVHNQCINLHRTRTRQDAMVRRVATLAQRAVGDGGKVQESVEATALRQELCQVIHQALARLPLRLREPVQWYFYEGIPCPVIAHRLHLTPAAVRKRLQHARTLMRGYLHTYMVQTHADAGGAGVVHRTSRLPQDSARPARCKNLSHLAGPKRLL